MWFRDICFTCYGSSTTQIFPLLFSIGILNYSKVLIQMNEGYAAIQSGGGLPVEGGWVTLMTHGAGSVTTQSIALNM